MKTIAFFNNKSGVGKTTLVYHLASMFAELGVRVLAADLDPQANLTTMSLSLDTLDALEGRRLPTIYDVVAPTVFEVTDRFGLLLGDLDLSFLEDALSGAWADGRDDSPLVRSRGMRITAALAKAVRDAGRNHAAELALIDVGPNLGAINRAAILAADCVIVPVAPDIFSLKGLTNVGKSLTSWRSGWASRASETQAPGDGWPIGEMEPLGYIVSRFSIYKGENARHFRYWIDQVPRVFQHDVLGEMSAASNCR
jgi:cellulose biosynthesis protein BcsQ